MCQDCFNLTQVCDEMPWLCVKIRRPQCSAGTLSKSRVSERLQEKADGCWLATAASSLSIRQLGCCRQATHARVADQQAIRCSSQNHQSELRRKRSNSSGRFAWNSVQPSRVPSRRGSQLAAGTKMGGGAAAARWVVGSGGSRSAVRWPGGQCLEQRVSGVTGWQQQNAAWPGDSKGHNDMPAGQPQATTPKAWQRCAGGASKPSADCGAASANEAAGTRTAQDAALDAQQANCKLHCASICNQFNRKRGIARRGTHRS